MTTTRLSRQERTVLWLYGGEGMSAKQAALEMGVVEETASSYLRRVRQKLRQRGVDADTRVDLFLAALINCGDMPGCVSTRRFLLRHLTQPSQKYLNGPLPPTDGSDRRASVESG